MTHRLWWLLCLPLLSTGLLAEPVGTLAEADGVVEIASAEQPPAPVAQGATINEGDQIRTGPAPAFAQLQFQDQSIVKLGPNSELVITVKSKRPQEVGLFRKRTQEVDTTVLDLNLGQALFKVEGFKKRTTSFEVRTPNAVAGVRGTLWEEIVQQLSNPGFITNLTVFRGRIGFTATGTPTRPGRTVVVRGGNHSNVHGTGNPSRPRPAGADALQRGLQFQNQTSGTPPGDGGGLQPGANQNPGLINQLLDQEQRRRRLEALQAARQEGATRRSNQPPAQNQVLPLPPPPP